MPDEPEPFIFQTLDRTARYPYPRSSYLARGAWNIVQATVFRWSPARAFGWRRWLLRRFGAKLGANTYIRPRVRIHHPWKLTTGVWCTLADGVIVYNLGEVKIGSHTVISQDAFLCAGTHDYSQADLPLQLVPITIGSGVWICAGAFIAPGATVGDNSVIGARAVVAGNVPSGVVAAGNPAKVLKPRRMSTTRSP